MSVVNNLMAMNAHRILSSTNAKASKSMEKLSSGFRINRSSDDAAGLAISEKMRGQIRGLNQAQRNAQDGISLIQTAEGAMQEIHAILQRARELAVQSANDTNTDSIDRETLQQEIDQLIGRGMPPFVIVEGEIGRIALQTEFNNKKLLDGNGGHNIIFQIGANEGQNIMLDIEPMDWMSITSPPQSELNINTQAAANNAIAIVNYAINRVSEERAKLGAVQNRLEHSINNLGTTSENLQASESRIRDVDMAKEMMEHSKLNILQQASTAMLAQANQAPRGVLELLK